MSRIQKWKFYDVHIMHVAGSRLVKMPCVIVHVSVVRGHVAFKIGLRFYIGKRAHTAYPIPES